MNADRNTNGFTPLTYLNWIQRGSTEDWRHLYTLCRDPQVAWTVAGILGMRDPDMMPSARLWKFLLEDLHPELHFQIDLRGPARDRRMTDLGSRICRAFNPSGAIGMERRRRPVAEQIAFPSAVSSVMNCLAKNAKEPKKEMV